MKTTIELPDELLREAKAAAAREGRSLRALFMEALSQKLHGPSEVEPGAEAWRGVFGRATAAEVLELDEIVAGEFESIDPASWR